MPKKKTVKPIALEITPAVQKVITEAHEVADAGKSLIETIAADFNAVFVQPDVKAKKGKKKDETSPVVLDLLGRLNRSIDGRARLTAASDAYTPFHIRRPTGLLSLDLAMNGGFSAGTINQIFGPPNTGKTYLTNELIAQVQTHYGDSAKIGVASFGYPFDADFARIFSRACIPYSTDEIRRARAEAKDEGHPLTEAELSVLRHRVGELVFIEPSDWEKPAESVLTGVLELIRSGEFQLLLIDETNVGETQYGVEKELGESPRTADFASLMTQFIKKFYSAIKQPAADGSPNRTCVVEILEVRDNLASTRGGKSQGGGHALKHAKAIDLHLSSWQAHKENDKEVGKEVEWSIDKGKMGVQAGGAGTFIFRHGYGADKEMDLLTVAESMGLVQKSGSWWSTVEGERIGQGLSGAARALRGSDGFRDLRQKLIDQCYKLRGIRRYWDV